MQPTIIIAEDHEGLRRCLHSERDDGYTSSSRSGKGLAEIKLITAKADQFKGRGQDDEIYKFSPQQISKSPDGHERCIFLN